MKKLEKAKFAPPPVWLEDQVRRQQMLCGLKAVITNTGQQNPLNSAAVFVHLMARERSRFSSAPNVMLACAWCLVSWNITQKCICRPLRIVNSVCCDKIVIEGATDLLQQPELCK